MIFAVTGGEKTKETYECEHDVMGQYVGGLLTVREVMEIVRLAALAHGASEYLSQDGKDRLVFAAQKVERIADKLMGAQNEISKATDS